MNSKKKIKHIKTKKIQLEGQFIIKPLYVEIYHDSETSTLFASVNIDYDTGSLTSRELVDYLKKESEIKCLKIDVLIYTTWDSSFGSIDNYSVYIVDSFDHFESRKGPSAIFIDEGYTEIHWSYLGHEIHSESSDNYVKYFSEGILMPYNEVDENGIQHSYLITENGTETYPGIPGIFGEKFDFDWFSIEFLTANTTLNYKKIKVNFKFELEEPKLK